MKQLLINSSEKIFSTLLLMTNLLRINTVFLPPFPCPYFCSFYVGKKCNHCAQGQGDQKTLNNSLASGLKNTLDRVGAITLKLEN